MTIMDEKQLVTRWNAIFDGAAEAITWVNSVRGNAPRLNTEADNLIYKLRRSRNMAKNLITATQKPMTVGFFGLSQAGKSYLISSLAAGNNGRLTTEMSGQTLDFIRHINPPGSGKEATGLVTRFTRHSTKGNQDYPVELQLFSEIEIAKILTNAYLYDFNQEKFDYELNDEKITQLINSLDRQKSAQPITGVTSDDVVSLWDYLLRHAENSQKKLAAVYWPKAIEIAPFLSITQRAKLFSPLWGEIPELTDAYLRFSTTLEKLGHSSIVIAPLSVLVKDVDGILVQNDSIMNVDMLERLNQDIDTLVAVCPVQGEHVDTPITLSLAELTALTVELIIPLAEKPHKTLFESVELLDFPGYRGRLSVESMADVRRAVNSDNANPLAQLILRGKVAYLFERYTDNHEMNVLVVCTASTKQSDVREVGGVLTEWIHHTQGKDPATRAKRPSGLIWALTMFDMRIQNSLSFDEALLRQSWGKGGMIKMAMLERFGQYSWMQEWLPNQPFNNTFLVRKPRIQTPFIRLQNNQEVELDEGNASQLGLMKKTFTEDETVQRYIHAPADAWDAMLNLNDGGMATLSQYLETVTLKELKLARIAEQLDELQRDLVASRLEKWHQAGGDEELNAKRKNAETILRFMQSRPYLQGALLSHLLPARKDLHELYMQDKSASNPKTTETHLATKKSASVFDMGNSGFDLFGETAPPSQVPEPERPQSHGYEIVYPQKVIALWINHLRSLPDNQELLDYLGMEQEVMVLLADELITAASRMNVEQRMIDSLANTELVGVRRDAMVERQVSRVYNVLGDFITWFNFKAEEAKCPESKINRGHKIFERPNHNSVTWGDDDRLVQLPATPVNYTYLFVYDWLIALEAIIKDNAGHSAGREIDAEQNEQLGKIIQLMKSSSVES